MPDVDWGSLVLGLSAPEQFKLEIKAKLDIYLKAMKRAKKGERVLQL